MDVSLLLATLVCLAIIVSAILLLLQSRKGNAAGANAQGAATGGSEPAAARPRVRGMQRLNRSTAATEDDLVDDENEETEETAKPKKIGAKKEAKLAMKERAKEEREQMLAQRAEREAQDKIRDQQEKEARAAEEAAELELKKKQEKEEEEKKKKEQEEYEKIKAMFSVEGAGSSEDTLATETKKVVLLEEIANQFHLKTKDVINRVRSLEESGQLTGFMDDRGKFVYVTNEELANVAKWIKQRGRVSILDLSDSSSSLVRLSEE